MFINSLFLKFCFAEFFASGCFKKIHGSLTYILKNFTFSYNTSGRLKNITIGTLKIKPEKLEWDVSDTKLKTALFNSYKNAKEKIEVTSQIKNH